jgi:hypothetical protein
MTQKPHKITQTLNVVQSDAKRLALAARDRLPADLVSQLLSANNQMLKAAIIQHGGGLEISTQAIYETLTHKGHVVATENEDGSIRLSLARKQEIEQAGSELLAL